MLVEYKDTDYFKATLSSLATYRIKIPEEYKGTLISDKYIKDMSDYLSSLTTPSITIRWRGKILGNNLLMFSKDTDQKVLINLD